MGAMALDEAADNLQRKRPEKENGQRKKMARERKRPEEEGGQRKKAARGRRWPEKEGGLLVQSPNFAARVLN
jgi:hypothetical protein